MDHFSALHNNIKTIKQDKISEQKGEVIDFWFGLFSKIVANKKKKQTFADRYLF